MPGPPSFAAPAPEALAPAPRHGAPWRPRGWDLPGQQRQRPRPGGESGER